MSTATATKTRTTFRMEVGIAIDIEAAPSTVWRLLTDVPTHVGWNSTVKSIDGTIAEGQTLRLVATVAPERTFKLKVSDVRPDRSMVWSDGFAPMFKGQRTFTLTPTAAGTRFEMVEVFSGVMLPMIAGQLPDFGPVFETYAEDLKRAAESA